MRAIVFAAGKSPMTDAAISDLTIHGEKLLDIQVSVLRNIGAENVTLVAGYESGHSSRSDISVCVNHDWANSGAAGSLDLVKDLFDGSDDIMMVYGDTLFDTDVLRSLMRSTGPVSAACLFDRSHDDQGLYREYAIIEGGSLFEITPSPNSHGVRTVLTGLLYVEKSKAAAVRGFIDSGLIDRDKHLGELLNRMISLGVEISPVLIEGGWAEITSDHHYEKMLQDTELIERVMQIHVDWTKRAEKYDRLDWVNNDSLLAAMVAVAKSHVPDTVLDVGTGTGKVLKGLRDSLGNAECWGLDYSQAMLDMMSDPEGLKLVCSDAETMDGLPESYFDLVTARMVFHHLDNPDAVLSGIARVMKSGGCCILCEGVPPTLQTAPWYTEMFRFKEDRRTVTEVDLISMLLRAGFRDVRTESIEIRGASLNNWLDNSGIPQKNIDIIKEMHYSAPEHVKADYSMEFTGGDCLMNWRFAVTYGFLA